MQEALKTGLSVSRLVIWLILAHDVAFKDWLSPAPCLGRKGKIAIHIKLYWGKDLMKIQTLGLASICMILASCGGGEEAEPGVYLGDEELANGMTISEMIEARQDGFEDIGGAFKTINDELKKGEPDVTAIQSAAATVESLSQDVGDWFPEETGASSGVETEALDSIWEDPEGFEAAIAKFQTAASGLNTAAETGEVEAIQAAFKDAGATCKNCHDNYRLDD